MYENTYFETTSILHNNICCRRIVHVLTCILTSALFVTILILFWLGDVTILILFWFCETKYNKANSYVTTISSISIPTPSRNYTVMPKVKLRGGGMT